MVVANLVSPTDAMNVVFRQPLLHFLIIGALLYTGQQLLPEARLDTAPIRISASDLDRLRSEWRRETARVPSVAELDASLRRYGDEEILVQEALREELDVRDPVARERLLMNMRFAFPDVHGDDEALLQQAQALGMNQRDIVVRRRLVQLMEMRSASAAALNEPQLRAHVAAHPERYAQAQHFGFRQVFVKAEQVNAQARAQRLLTELQQGASGIKGDSFLLGADIPPQSYAQIARFFGEEFAQVVMQAPRDQWIGPLRSSYGWHLVQVGSQLPALPADFDKVRARAAYALLTESEARSLRAELQRLRRAYPLEVTAVSDTASRVLPKTP